MKKFNAFISEMKQKKLDVDAIFDSYSDLKIGLYDEGLEKKINDIEQMNQYMKEIEREKQRKNKEENEERKRWSN